MGNQCCKFIHNLFSKPPHPELQSLNQSGISLQSENYTQVNIQDETFNEYSQRDVLELSESVQQSAHMGEELFQFRRRTLQKMEKMYQDSQMTIEYQSYQLEDRYTIVQLKYRFHLECSVEEFCNYQYLEHVEKYSEMEKNGENSTIYVSFKKMQFLDPREYVFVKTTKRLCEGKYLQVLRSIKSELAEKETRGQILVSGFLVRESNGLEIEGYSEIDLRTKLPSGMIKRAIVIELKKVIQKLIN